MTDFLIGMQVLTLYTSLRADIPQTLKDQRTKIDEKKRKIDDVFLESFVLNNRKKNRTIE
jgi:hypothetical protein